MENDDSALNELFHAYRAACPDIEPGANFVSEVWRKIDTRRSFGFAFELWARTVMTASAALCVLLLVLNFVSASQNHSLAPTYVDALMADHTAENTYYTEAIRQ